MEHLQKNSSEFSVTRNYLDWLTAVPWGKHGDEVYDIAKTKVVSLCGTLKTGLKFDSIPIRDQCECNTSL